MSASQEQLAADILDTAFTPIGGVPGPFAEYVADQIAARPSPTAAADPLVEIRAKLDEILTLLRGGPPE